MKKPVPHGTVNGYSNYRCRCELCRDAASSYMRARRQPCIDCGTALVYPNRKRCRACHAMAMLTAECGTEAKYKRCRCDDCRAAAAAARKQRRHANSEATRAYNREYKRQRRAAA